MMKVKVKVWTWKSHVTRHTHTPHWCHVQYFLPRCIHSYIHTFYIVSVYFLRPPPRIDNPMLFHQKYIKIQSNSHKGIKKIYFYRTKTYFQYFFFVFSIFCQKTIKGSLVFSFLLLWIVWIVSTTIHVQQIIDNSLSFLRLKHIKFMRQEQIVLGRQLGCIHGSIGIHQRHRHKDHGQHIPCGIWTLYQQCTFCRQWW